MGRGLLISAPGSCLRAPTDRAESYTLRGSGGGIQVGGVFSSLVLELNTADQPVFILLGRFYRLNGALGFSITSPSGQEQSQTEGPGFYPAIAESY